MSLNGVIYPYNIEARKLPIHLTGIGGTDWQQPISRPTGYHWHQIILSEAGEGVLKYDNMSVKIPAGSAIFLPANYPHEYRAVSNGWRVKFVTFDGYSAAHVLSLLGLTRPTVVQIGDKKPFTALFERMTRLLSTDKVYGCAICSGLVYQFLLEFYRSADIKPSRGRAERSELIAGVLGYIEEHYKEDFPLSVLSEKAGVSHQHFCRVFKESMNVRPKEYINRLRIREAKRLLTETKKPIAKIAEEVGFSESAYFCAVFKKAEGRSPLEYRKAAAGSFFNIDTKFFE